MGRRRGPDTAVAVQFIFFFLLIRLLLTPSHCSVLRYNSRMKLSHALALLADDPEHPVDLARVALLIARDAYSHLSPRAYLRRIDRLADRLRPRLRGSLAARTAALSTFLFEECGFAGNTEHYYDPRKQLSEQGPGPPGRLPISLSLLAMAVGDRAGSRSLAFPAGSLRCEGGESKGR